MHWLQILSHRLQGSFLVSCLLIHPTKLLYYSPNI
jgi:hypothetical protein